MRVVRWALVASLWLSMLPVTESRAAAPAPPLFDAPAGVRTVVAGAPSRVTVRQRRASARLSLLTRADGSPALAAGDRVRLNLFDDASFSMSVAEGARHAGGGLSLAGTLDGVDLGYAVLAVHDGALVGHVSMPTTAYRIGYLTDGTPVVEEIDPSAMPPEGHATAPAEAQATALDGDPPATTPDSASQIDVMVFYTEAARLRAGGTAAMRAEVALAVAVSNQAYTNNDLVQRLRLVYTGESSIVETNSFSTDLARIRGDATVAFLRNLTRADLVSLIVDNGDSAAFCGIGFLMTTNTTFFASSAFSVVERRCATGNLTFPHELGHNMGAHHDVFVAGTDTTLAAYSHGFVDLIGKFRTIMAYPDQCSAAGLSCPKVPFFSSPDKTVGGRTVGNVATADNARTLGNTANNVANFRTALTSPLALGAGVNRPTVAVGETLVTSVNITHPGGAAGAADFYVGLLLPDGGAVFFTSLTITGTSGYALGALTNVSSYRPIATGIPLGAPFTANIASLFAYPRQPGDPTGGLAFFVLAVKAGALADGLLTTDELLSASFAPFTFPAGNPADAG